MLGLFLFMVQKMRIPDDNWQEEDGYCLILLCVPRSVQWIGTVKGRIYELGTGRAWDERTGRVTEAQAVGKRIWESVCMICTDVFEDINKNLAALVAGLNQQNSLLFEVSRVAAILDRIRDNLDATTPDGGAAEYGLASILAAWGPNQTKNTEYLKNINAAVNGNAVTIPSETAEYSEPGQNPALVDVVPVTSIFASRVDNRVWVGVTCAGPVKVLIGVKYTSFMAIREAYPPDAGWWFDVAENNLPDTGLVEVIDQTGTYFSAIYSNL